MAGERESRATFAHKWITIFGVPLIIALVIWFADQFITMRDSVSGLQMVVLAAQRDLAKEVQDLHERNAEIQRAVQERDARIIRMIERLEDRMEARIPRPPL